MSFGFSTLKGLFYLSNFFSKLGKVSIVKTY